MLLSVESCNFRVVFLRSVMTLKTLLTLNIIIFEIVKLPK